MAKNDTPEIPGLFDDLPEEAPQEQIAKISLRSWRTHLASIRTLDKHIEKLIDEAVKQALAQGRRLTSADIGRVFQRHPELRAELDKTMQQLNDDLTATIEQGSKDAWLRANTAADAVVAAMANNNAQLAALLNAGTNKPQNDRALRAFQQREMQGLKLSDRVWRATEGMKLDMERAIEVALAEGVPAQKLSERVRELLKEPHRLYRRVRDKDGNLRLSQAAQKYHPGTGVYRSSYKNAMRVARTEVNMAYQASDNERWTRSWWVKGIRVSLSNNHTCLDSKGRPAALVDICDELAGDYPADFKFTGWHPQCRCFATAITCEYTDIRDYYRRKRAGEDMTGYTPPGTITEPPEQFKRWMADNSDRLAGAAQRGTTPYFIANNAKYTDPNWKPSKATASADPMPAKTQAEHVKLEVLLQSGGESLKPLTEEEKLNSIIELTGATTQEAKRYLDAVESFSHGWDYEIREYQRTGSVQRLKEEHTIEEIRAKAEALEEFLSKSPQWVAPTYRGMGVTEEEYNAILLQLKEGAFDMRGTASWTSEISDAKRYAYDSRWEKPRLVVFECEANGRATSIRHLSIHPDENEVLVSNGTKYRIVGEPIEDKIYGRTPVLRIRVEAIDAAQTQTARKKTPLQIADERHARRTAEDEQNIRESWNLHKEANKLRNSGQYTGVRVKYDNGGLMATHTGHNFDKQKGWYEKRVQEIGFDNGHKVILENERGGDFYQKFTEGKWDGRQFEIATRETGTANNILRGLKHCADKPNTEIAVLYFPNGFDEDNLANALKRYKSLEKHPERTFVKFKRVVCITDDGIVYDQPL